MREQRRHVSLVVSPLEMLDDRIVPSVMGPIPKTIASLANHHSHHHANHANAHGVHAHVSRAHAAHRIVLASGTGNALARATQVAAAAAAAPSAVTAQSSAAVSGNPVIAQTSGASNTPSTTAAPTAAVVANAPATSVSGGSPSSGPSTTGTVATNSPSGSPNADDLKNGPMAKAGQDLIAVYQEFQHNGGGDSFTSSQAARIQFQGAKVGIDAVSTGANFDAFVSAMTSLGMQVTRTDASHSLVEGFLPISRLPDAAQNPLTLSLSAMYRPEQFSS